MNNVMISMILTIIAASSTLIGTLLIFIFNKKTDNIIINSIYFSIGVIVSVSLNELIPESLSLLSNTYIFQVRILLILIFINIGILISISINSFIKVNNTSISSNNKNLYKVGIISMIALIIHNIPEGIATFTSSSTNMNIGVILMISIALHNIPEGISISLPIYYATNNKIKAISYTFISGMSEVFGAILAYIFLSKYIDDVIMSIILSITAGIMLHISFYELLPSIKKYKKNLYNYSFLLMGYLLIIIIHFIINK